MTGRYDYERFINYFRQIEPVTVDDCGVVLNTEL